jgi:hypothetical protein
MTIMFLAKPAIKPVLAFLGSEVFRTPFAVLKIDQLLYDVIIRQAGDVGILRTSHPVGVVAQAARKDRRLRRLFAVGDDVGHRRMILGKPIGGAERLATCARVNVSLDPGRVSGVVLSSGGGAAA